MLGAALLAAFGQAALLLGAILVWKFPGLTKPVYVGFIMAFGAGAIISALSIDLVAVSYEIAGSHATALGLAIGAVGYYAIIALLERSGKSENPEKPVEVEAKEGSEHVHGASPTEARNLFIGMIVDGVPESVSIGLTMHTAGAIVSFALVGSVFIAGLPEAIGVAAALLAGGIALRKILVRFSIIVVIGAIAGALGFTLLDGADPALIAIIQSIAAGALLVVVVNEMVPIAVRGAKRWAGPMAAAGFVFSAILTWAGDALTAGG